MKNTITALLLLLIATMLYTACKKSSGVSLSPFAQSLQKECNGFFVGRGDSGNICLPTAFTPNGDGLDDVYGVEGNTSDLSGFKLVIYDTTGNLVYQATQPHAWWDGTDMTTGKQSTKYKFYVKINYTTAGNITDSGGSFLFLLASDSAKACVYAVPADSARYRFGSEFDAITGSYNAAWNLESYCN